MSREPRGAQILGSLYIFTNCKPLIMPFSEGQIRKLRYTGID